MVSGRFLPLLSLLVSMATAAWQKHPSLAGSNTDKFNTGSKAVPAFRKARKCAIFLSPPFHCHPLFQSCRFWFGALGWGLIYHTCFSPENSRDKCGLFSGISPDSLIGRTACTSGCFWETHAKRNPGWDSGLQPGCQDTCAMWHTVGGLPKHTHSGFLKIKAGDAPLSHYNKCCVVICCLVI